MNDIMKIVTSLEESGLLIKSLRKLKRKTEKGRFLSMLSGIFGASLLRSLLTGNSTIRAFEGTIRGGQDF